MNGDKETQSGHGQVLQCGPKHRERRAYVCGELEIINGLLAACPALAAPKAPLATRRRLSRVGILSETCVFWQVSKRNERVCLSRGGLSLSLVFLGVFFFSSPNVNTVSRWISVEFLGGNNATRGPHARTHALSLALSLSLSRVARPDAQTRASPPTLSKLCSKYRNVMSKYRNVSY